MAAGPVWARPGGSDYRGSGRGQVEARLRVPSAAARRAAQLARVPLLLLHAPERIPARGRARPAGAADPWDRLSGGEAREARTRTGDGRSDRPGCGGIARASARD